MDDIEFVEDCIDFWYLQYGIVSATHLSKLHVNSCGNSQYSLRPQVNDWIEQYNWEWYLERNETDASGAQSNVWNRRATFNGRLNVFMSTD
jgi:hypothetical protein